MVGMEAAAGVATQRSRKEVLLVVVVLQTSEVTFVVVVFSGRISTLTVDGSTTQLLVGL